MSSSVVRYMKTIASIFVAIYFLLLSGCAPFVYPGYYDDAYYPDMYYMCGNVRYCNYGGRYYYYRGHHWYYAPHLPYGGHYIQGRNYHNAAYPRGYQRGNAYYAPNRAQYSASGVNQQQGRQNYVNGQSQSPQNSRYISQNRQPQPTNLRPSDLRAQSSSQRLAPNSPQAQQYIQRGQQQGYVSGQPQTQQYYRNHTQNVQPQLDNHRRADHQTQASYSSPVTNSPQALQNAQRAQQQGSVNGQNQLNTQNQNSQSQRDNHRHTDHQPQASNLSPVPNSPQGQHHDASHGQQQNQAASPTNTGNSQTQPAKKPAKKKDDQKKADQ